MSQGSLSSAWLIWLGIALVSAIVEVVSVALFFLMVATGALVAALLAMTGFSPIVQIVGFAVSTAALLLLVRPALLERLRSRGATTTGTEALVGRHAETTTVVTQRSGQIKLAGEVWSARLRTGESLPVGVQVVVIAIDGATAIVATEPS